MGKLNYKAAIATGVALIVLFGGGYLFLKSKPKEPEHKDPIKIGSIGMYSGKGAPYGEANKRGLEIAKEEINANGGINGRMIEIVYESEGDTDQDAVNAIEKLISKDGVDVIIGPMKSSAVLAVASRAEEEKILLYAPDATTPALSDSGEYIYRGCSRIDEQSERLARYTYETIGKKTVSVLYSDEPYGQGSLKMYKSYYEKLGGKILGEYPFKRGDKDFKTQLVKIKNENAEALFIPGYYSETAPAAVQARELGLNQPIIGVYGNMVPDYIKIGGSSVEGSVMAVEYDENYETEKNNRFRTKYYDAIKANPNESNNIMFAALSYDALYLIADGMKKNSPNAEGVKKFLDEVKDYDGVTGKLSFDSKGDVKKGEIILVKVVNGKFEKI